MRAGMSYFHETIWKGVPRFLRRVDTALKNIGINERVPYNAPLIQFSSWMGGDRDGIFLPFRLSRFCVRLFQIVISMFIPAGNGGRSSGKKMYDLCVLDAGNPRVTPEVTRDVCLLARMMAANLYYSQIEDLMFEVSRSGREDLGF